MNIEVISVIIVFIIVVFGPSLYYFYARGKRRQLNRRIRSFNERKVFISYGLPFAKCYIVCKDTITAFELAQKLKKDGERFVKIEQRYYLNGSEHEKIQTKSKED